MDAIFRWNEIALEVHRRDFSPGGTGDTADAAKPTPKEVDGPTRVSRGFAILHIATFDVVAAYPANGLIATRPVGQGVGSTSAAVAGAAMTALADVWRGQASFIAAMGRSFIAGLSDSPADIEAGLAFGTSVAKSLLGARMMDGSQAPDDYVPDPIYGGHRADPYAPDQGSLGPHWGSVKPFCIASNNHANYVGAPPRPGDPATGARYLAALRDVRGKGIDRGSTRNPDETVQGIFWGYDGAQGLGVPPRLYNQVLRALAVKEGNTMPENARLFAMANAAMADGGIIAWGAKYAYKLWRPVLGVREHDAGYGQAPGFAGPPVESDPFWAPLGAPQTNRDRFNRTPGFPAYPSGHATFGAAAFGIAARFFAKKTGKTAYGNTESFSFVSDEFDGRNKDPGGDIRTRINRTLTLERAIVENALSRVYLGVHWRFDGIGAVAPDDDAIVLKPPADPATGATLPADQEKGLGGVPAGLKIAKEIFTGHFREAPAAAAPAGDGRPRGGRR